jgi:hypothetical protein
MPIRLALPLSCLRLTTSEQPSRIRTTPHGRGRTSFLSLAILSQSLDADAYVCCEKAPLKSLPISTA